MNQTPSELLSPYRAAVVAAVQELLRVSSTAATIFRVPGTEPEQIILAGEIEALNKLLESHESAPPVSWHKLGAAPRSWTIVLSADSGVVGELGCKFEKVPERLERVDVVEAELVLRQLGELQQENAELRSALAAAEAPAATINGQPIVGKLLDDLSALPVLWGLNEPGALLRNSDVFKMLVDADKALKAEAKGLHATASMLPAPQGWTVERVGDAMHIKRADGKWCGYMVENGPAAALTFEFLSDLAATSATDQAEAQQDAPRDTERLDALAANYWDLRSVNIQTGGDDCDVTWRVIEHHMTAPHERVIADAYGDNPRRAIDAALSSQKGASDEICIYPKCNCPLDAPSDPKWCARGLSRARPSGAKAGEDACAHCNRLPGERRDECEHCPAGAAPAHPGEGESNV